MKQDSRQSTDTEIHTFHKRKSSCISFLIFSLPSVPLLLCLPVKKLDFKARFVPNLLCKAFCDHNTTWSLSPLRPLGTLWPPASDTVVYGALLPTTLQGASFIRPFIFHTIHALPYAWWVQNTYLIGWLNEWMVTTCEAKRTQPGHGLLRICAMLGRLRGNS